MLRRIIRKCQRENRQALGLFGEASLCSVLGGRGKREQKAKIMSEYEIVIGLEVHVQLNTVSKAFCACSTVFENPPNSNICPVCCGYPGVLPVFNQRALALAVRTALALQCRINPKIYFERKHYFYPDLPKGYQISQYKKPLGEEGFLEITGKRKIRINRVHLEEDAGKLIHKEEYSLVDLNRAGVPLLEIVSEPDIHSPEEAFDYLTYLKLTLQYISASDCDMEKGLLRCDANISLRKRGETRLGTKVELKNMNTFRGVRDALEYEAKRQEGMLAKGGTITQETRLWDAQALKSVVMRSKEEAHDYRYFPEPDLLDFTVPAAVCEQEKNQVGEMPLQKRQRFLDQYGVSEKEADILIAYKELTVLFEESLGFLAEPKQIMNWLLGPFLEQLNVLPEKFKSVAISAQNFTKIIKYFLEGKLNNLAAKKVLALSIATNKDIDAIIQEEKLVQVSNEDDLIGFVDEVIKENPKPVSQFLEGKEQAVMFLVGQVMKKSKGKANPKVVRDIFERRIKK